MAKILKSARFDPEPVTAGRNHLQPRPNDAPAEKSPMMPAPPPPDPHAEAERIVQAAKAEAHALIARAEAEAEQIRKKARQVGLETGYNDGKQAAEKEAAEGIANIKRIAEAMSAEHEALLHNTKEYLGTLALAIAKKILTHTLTVQPEVVADMVAEVIEAANIHGGCYVHVHPSDYKILQPHWEAVSHLQQPDSSWELVSDNRVSRGGCMIDIEGGTIDARMQTKLAQIETALAKAIE